jgi:hypothetical protein
MFRIIQALGNEPKPIAKGSNVAADKVTEALVEALHQALADSAEHRLYKSGKLEGLFAGRTGVKGDAAARALREGLLEVSRTEGKGKTTIEWVRLTPRGVEFLHEHESPLRAIQELQESLRANLDAVPRWLASLKSRLQEFETSLAADVQRAALRLETLARRVEDTLKRLAEKQTGVPDELATLVPWAAEALAYLERRRTADATTDCPLPELFAFLSQGHPSLSITAFHDGLRRLHESRVLKLAPFTGSPNELHQPEFVLLDGATCYYHASR